MITRSLVALVALSLAVSVSGCAGRKAEGTARAVLEASAVSVVETEGLRIAYQDRRDAECRETARTFPAWRECMDPAYRLDQAVGVFRNSLLAAETSIDASGVDGWAAMAPCLLSAAESLGAALEEAGLPIPEEVGVVLSLGARFAGECNP